MIFNGATNHEGAGRTRSGREAAGAVAAVAAATLLGWSSSSFAATESVLRINAGGDNYTDTAGRLWSADHGFNTGSVAHKSNAIDATLDDLLYQTQRWDGGSSPELAYRFNLANGDYQLKLHFAENWSPAFTPGVRVFDVLVEGQVALDNFDIARAVGGNTAHVVTVPTTVRDGRLDVEFMHQVQNPTIAAIEVLRVTPDPAAAESGSTTTSDRGILREYWANISGSALSNLTSSSRYPSDPTSRSVLSSFEAPSHVADNYGSRIRGYLHPPANGYYTFWISGDDNSDLLLSTDDNPANARRIAYVSGWTSPRQWTKSSSQRSAQIYLSAGRRYYIETLHKEGVGGDHLAVAWQSNSISQQVIPGTVLSPWVDITAAPTASGTGLSGQYFDNIDFTAPVLTRTDPQIGFDWGRNAPVSSMGVDTFSVRWSGQVEPAHTIGSRTYTFTTRSDDGVRLWVDNRLIIDRWVNQSPTERSGTISLEAGKRYDIRLEYYENGGGAVAELFWQADGFSRERIPAARLYPVATAEAPAPAPAPTAPADADSDGLPDSWELQHGLNPNDAGDVHLDPDGDGYSNLHEFQASTSPTSATSKPALQTNGSLSLNWSAPVTRTDGQPIAMSELGGYRLHYGIKPGVYTSEVTVGDAYTTEWTISGLDTRLTYYFVVTAVDRSGVEGPASNEVFKAAH